MFINPRLATQLAREHQRQLLAQASQRQLAHQHRRPANGTQAPPGSPAAWPQRSPGPAGWPRTRPAPSGQPGRTRSANQPGRPRRQATATDGSHTRHHGRPHPTPGRSRRRRPGPLAVSKLGTSMRPGIPVLGLN